MTRRVYLPCKGVRDPAVRRGEAVWTKLFGRKGDRPAAKAAMYRSEQDFRAFLLDDNEVRKAIRQGIERFAFALAPDVVRYLEAVVKGTEHATRERTDIVKLVLQLAGLPAQNAAEDKGKRPLQERSREELLAVIRQAEDAARILSDKARPVLNAPGSAPTSAQSGGLLD